MPGKRILLVDYDPRSLSHTRDVLEGAGFSVSTCGDGISALDQYKSLSPDLVLLSAMLPKMHGFEVCSTIRKLPGGDKTPVVIITDVYKGKRYRVDAINKYGATEYIEKPIEDGNLVNILTGLIKENGRGAAAPVSDTEVADDRTVQFSRDLLSQMVKEVPIGRTNAPSEKRNVTDKPKPKDDISRKLEESLAGLDLGVGRTARPKPKSPETTAARKNVASAPNVAAPVKEDSGPIFTSEDLFTDVIASVERELQSEKIIPAPEDAPSEAPTVMQPSAQVQMANPAEAPSVRAAEVIKPVVPAPSEAPRKAAFDSDLEKKLSSTLSGLKKEQAAKQSAQLKASEARKAESTRKTEAAVAAGSAAIPSTPKLPPAPAVPKPEVKVPVVAAAVAKEISQEGINFGQYLLLSKIATGGMAELFKAKRKGVEGFEKILAIKRILPHMSDNDEFVTMFIDEAKLAAQLSHHNICQIFDLGKIENSYYIAMEYVHGRDLRAVMKAARAQNRPVPVELAILISSKVASALDYAHRKKGSNGQPLNLVHRDVSPQNVLISYEGEVKLVDFGIAKAATKVHQTQHGALKGKLLYMSPEQAWGRAVDKRSDLFSLGIVLYELLAGRPLFFDENDTEVTILDKVREAKVSPIREYNRRVSADLERLVIKALRKNPDERYQVAFDLQKDLDNLFYTEGYNATGGTLADFIRSLFPEEWVHETVEKESKAPAAAAAPVAVATPAKAPAEPARQAEKVEVKPPVPIAMGKKQATPPMEEKRMERPPVGASIAGAAAAKSAGFRDISSPEIIPIPEGRKFPVVPVALGGVVVIGILAFLLFRPSSDNKSASVTPAPAKQQASATPVVQTPSVPAKPQPAPVKPAPQPAEAPAVKPEDARKAEEQKKLDAQKAEEEKKKEEDRKKQEKAKLDEQKQAAADEQEKAAQVPLPAPAPEETKMAEAQAPPVQTPVQEAPKQPEPVAEQPKEAPAKAAEPKSTIKEGDLVELTPDVVKPELLSRANPAYPNAAQAKRIEGTVILSVLVSENGSVGDVKVLRGAGGSSGLNEAAMAAIRKWKFRPAVKEGKRVKVWVTYPIVFKLQ